jgi:hypothetical protein
MQPIQIYEVNSFTTILFKITILIKLTSNAKLSANVSDHGVLQKNMNIISDIVHRFVFSSSRTFQNLVVSLAWHNREQSPTHLALSESREKFSLTGPAE